MTTLTNPAACQADEEFLNSFRVTEYSDPIDAELAAVLAAWSMDVRRDPWPEIDTDLALAAIRLGNRRMCRRTAGFPLLGTLSVLTLAVTGGTQLLGAVDLMDGYHTLWECCVLPALHWLGGQVGL